MKRYKVILRYICDCCSHQSDLVMFFDNIYAAKHCISLAIDKLQFDFCYLIDMQIDKVLIKIQEKKGGMNDEIQI